MKREVSFVKWIGHAKRDFDTAKYLIDGKRIEEGLFFLQQSVEKALKAVLIKKKKELVKTHDLNFLGRAIDLPHELFEYFDEILLLYNSNRYPDIEEKEVSDEDIENYINNAREVLEWAEEVI